MDEAPNFDFADIPHDEREATNDVQKGLHRLGMLVGEMRSAYELAEHTKSLMENPPAEFDGVEGISRRGGLWRKYGAWENMANKIGSLTIYDFYKVMRTTDTAYRQSPWLTGIVNQDLLKESNIMFDKGFPNWATLRNAAGHSGEHVVTAQDFKRDAAHDGVNFQGIVLNGAIAISGSLFNGHYTFTVEGKVVSYCLNQNTVEMLNAITRKRWSAFEKADFGYREKQRWIEDPEGKRFLAREE